MPPCFFYLIAGGDTSLIRSDELPEDDPLQGAQELEEITRDSKSAMVNVNVYPVMTG
jgi:N-acetylmuramic acid 6-phosphate (MurNAc-6-P) etherase